MPALFEINDLNGFSRKGEFHIGKSSIRTPILLYPTLPPYILKQQPLQDERTLENSRRCLAPIYFTDDFTEGYDSEKKEIIKNGFVKNKQPFGIGFPQTRTKELTEKLKRFHSLVAQEELQQIPIDQGSCTLILEDNLPVHECKYFQAYGQALNQERLSQYTEQRAILEKFEHVIVGLNFAHSMEKLRDTVAWCKANSFVEGIYFNNPMKSLYRFEEILQQILYLKENLPANFALIVGGALEVNYLPLLIYLGCDAFDLSYMIQRASQGEYFHRFGHGWYDNIKSIACSCESCRELDSLLQKRPRDLAQFSTHLVNHCLTLFTQEIRQLQYCQDEVSVREYMEAKIHSNPGLVSLLRRFDHHYVSRFLNRYKMQDDHPIYCGSSLSYFRPEIQNFLKRIQENVYPPEDFEMILLLPCSAGKPYSKSRSHQQFGKAIREGLSNPRDRKKISEVVVTSPMGVVPLQLEDVFPAQHYDIPVTGDWEDEELETAGRALAHWLSKYNHPIPIIAHVTGGYLEICRRAEQYLREKIHVSKDFAENNSENKVASFIYTCENYKHSTSNEALSKLTEVVMQIEETNKEGENTLTKRKLLSQKTEDELKLSFLVQYHFGPQATEPFIGGGCVLERDRSGHFARIQQYDGLGKKIIGQYKFNSGHIKLTWLGGQILAELDTNLLTLTDNSIRGSTVFPPIVENIAKGLAPGDQIAIVGKNGDYIGVGEMLVDSESALTLTYGAVADIHKKK